VRSKITPDDQTEQLEEMLARAGVPRRYMTCSWNTWQPVGGPSLDDALLRLREWHGAEDDPTTVLLCGPPGAGKTHLLTATLRRLLEARLAAGMIYSRTWTARWISVPGMLEQLRQAIGRGAENTLVERLRDSYLLCLDDLGVERGTPWAVETIYGLIDARYSHMRPTVVTSNLTPTSIATRLDSRIASRLSEGLVIELNLPDFRVNNANSPTR